MLPGGHKISSVYTICSCRSCWFEFRLALHPGKQTSAATWGLLQIRMIFVCPLFLFINFFGPFSLWYLGYLAQSHLSSPERMTFSILLQETAFGKNPTVSGRNPRITSHAPFMSPSRSNTKEEKSFQWGKWLSNMCKAVCCGMEIGERCSHCGGSCSCWSSFGFAFVIFSSGSLKETHSLKKKLLFILRLWGTCHVSHSKYSRALTVKADLYLWYKSLIYTE